MSRPLSGGAPPTMGVSSSEASTPELRICVNRRFNDKPSCAASGSVELAAQLERGLAARGVAATVMRTPCQNACWSGPAMRIVPAGPHFHFVTTIDIDGILDAVSLSAGPPDLAPPF